MTRARPRGCPGVREENTGRKRQDPNLPLEPFSYKTPTAMNQSLVISQPENDQVCRWLNFHIIVAENPPPPPPPALIQMALFGFQRFVFSRIHLAWTFCLWIVTISPEATSLTVFNMMQTLPVPPSVCVSCSRHYVILICKSVYPQTKRTMYNIFIHVKIVYPSFFQTIIHTSTMALLIKIKSSLVTFSDHFIFSILLQCYISRLSKYFRSNFPSAQILMIWCW